jgi:hypothetical protein
VLIPFAASIRPPHFRPRSRHQPTPSMLDSALEFFRDEVNAFIAARMGSPGVEVGLTRLVDETGKYAFAEDSLGLTLINLEEERTFRAQLPERSTNGGRSVVHEPALKLNLHILVAAHFKRYDEALKFLSCVLTYFQANAAFTAAAYPALDPRIERLTAELQSLTFEQLNQVWAYLGAKYLPSAVYRVRMVVLQDVAPTLAGPPITAIAAELRGR